MGCILRVLLWQHCFVENRLVARPQQLPRHPGQWRRRSRQALRRSGNRPGAPCRQQGRRLGAAADLPSLERRLWSLGRHHGRRRLRAPARRRPDQPCARRERVEAKLLRGRALAGTRRPLQPPGPWPLRPGATGGLLPPQQRRPRQALLPAGRGGDGRGARRSLEVPLQGRRTWPALACLARRLPSAGPCLSAAAAPRRRRRCPPLQRPPLFRRRGQGLSLRRGPRHCAPQQPQLVGVDACLVHPLPRLHIWARRRASTPGP